jgi:hypothetical protein
MKGGKLRKIQTEAYRILNGRSRPTCQSSSAQRSMVINLRTARALGLTVPLPRSAALDEEIEYDFFAAVHESVPGTSRTWSEFTAWSVMWLKADIVSTFLMGSYL